MSQQIQTSVEIGEKADCRPLLYNNSGMIIPEKQSRKKTFYKKHLCCFTGALLIVTILGVGISLGITGNYKIFAL